MKFHIIKRIGAYVLSAALLFGSLPTAAWAAGPSDNLCEHHPEHTAECGYTEGSEGTPCNHEHTEVCYTIVTECVHEHTADCYPAGGVSDNTATPSDAAEPTECDHECSEESGCITKKLDCPHEHDDECGYSPAEPDTHCTFVCEICNSTDSGNPAEPGQEPQCSCETLCTGGNVNTDCPVCSLEDADLSQCKGTEAELAFPSNAAELSVKDVQKLIDAPPWRRKSARTMPRT